MCHHLMNLNLLHQFTFPNITYLDLFYGNLLTVVSYLEYRNLDTL